MVRIPKLIAKQAASVEPLLFRLVRVLGIIGAYGTFFWRYVNVPENWGYVGSRWTMVIALSTILPEAVYPFLLFWTKIREVEWLRSRNTIVHKKRSE